MKFANSTVPTKIVIPMAPMINVIFLLLIFSMLSMKIVSPEANFNINLPVTAPSHAQSHASLPVIKVGLESDRDGNLTQLTLGGTNLGNDEAAFDRLNKELLLLIGRPGHPHTKDIEVELDADYECQYQYVAKAISLCTGKSDPQTQQGARYVEKIKFAPPHKPKS
ncbi:MAG: Biopolymer transport protein ExbD/TolR [Schlesneria sp.]|nr:Biopolymer transport protein ExbD/TolR [Schlesneria sp.]